MSSLRAKVESAVVAYLTGESVGATCYAGFSASDKAVPCVICSARSAEEDPPFSGNYRLTLVVEVKDTLDGSDLDSVANNVRSALWADDAAAAIVSNGSELMVWGLSAPHRMEWSVEEDCQVETHTIELYCAPKSFS